MKQLHWCSQASVLPQIRASCAETLAYVPRTSLLGCVSVHVCGGVPQLLPKSDDRGNTNSVRPDSIAFSVSQEINRRGITISCLARKIGVERTVVGRWLSGQRGMRARDAAAAMDVLGLKIISTTDRIGMEADHASNGTTRKVSPHA